MTDPALQQIIQAAVEQALKAQRQTSTTTERKAKPAAKPPRGKNAQLLVEHHTDSLRNLDEIEAREDPQIHATRLAIRALLATEPTLPFPLVCDRVADCVPHSAADPAAYLRNVYGREKERQSLHEKLRKLGAPIPGPGAAS